MMGGTNTEGFPKDTSELLEGPKAEERYLEIHIHSLSGSK